MKKTKTTFNAMMALADISKKLENSAYKILSLYNPSLDNPRLNGHFDRRFEDKQPEGTLDLQNPEVMDALKDNVEKLGKFLKTTPMETLVFVATYSIQLISGNDVDTRDFSKYFGFSGMDFLPLKKDLESIIKKGLVRYVEKRRRSDEYRVNREVENCFLENKPFKIQKTKAIDRYQFCKNISSYIENRDQEEIDTLFLFDLTEREEASNKNLTFIKQTMKLLPDIEDRLLFYEVCADSMSTRCHSPSVDCTLSDIYDDNHRRFTVARSIMDNSHELMVKGLIELRPTQFFSEAEVELTNKGKELFLEQDFVLFESKGGHDKRLISPDQIPDRQLFFGKELSKDLDFLKESLTEEKFVGLQDRLKERNLPTGVNVLLYGLPGTGKTASAEMIAKSTGRSVYHVDIAASKSCWFGQSEKLFKRIFDDYRHMCKTEERKPILLFNEADALFSKRKDVDSGNCAQTENALQNILLEEMEKMDGILIATTNLSENLDSAFDRRFLFKIKYGQPDKEAKTAIWKSKLEWLTDDECRKLAANYDLSGGEIDNIVRKSEMEALLHGNRPDLTMLESWCRNEKLNNGKCNAIGFNN
ncbi:MAG: ATP-binding protein [Bacteroidales bacterium]|nr:ATP-binding protein [Bacteroidales bacterium]